MEIRSTDIDSFRLVYQECYTLLMRICYHIVYNRDIAEDLVQEAFERFYLKNMSFETEDEAKYWLIRVAKNLALNQVRRKGRESTALDKLKSSSATADEKDGARELTQEETRREVRAAIESLPDNLRQVILLSEYGGLDYKSIGKVLGISEGNVKVRVHRARKKLEELLSGEDGYVY